MRTIITLSLCLLAWVNQVYAGCGDLTATPVTASYVTVDANDPCGTSTPVPQSAYIGYEICNTTGNPLEDISATFSVDASTSAKFTFSLAGGQAATQIFPHLAPGECNTFYWFVSYLSTNCSQNQNWHGGESLVFDISVDATDATTSTPCATTLFDNESKTTLTQNSANAGGQVIAQTITSADVLGGITQLCVDYSFGNTVAGAELNLQPAGNIDFDAGCFELINSEITYSELSGLLVGTQNQLGFTLSGTETDGTDANTSPGDVSVCYYFRSVCMNTSTSALPYSDTRSGGIHKYTGNFSSQLGAAIDPVTALPTINKTASQTDFITNGQAITYTVQICNPSATSAISIENVVDILPTGFTYTGMTAAASTSFVDAPVKPGSGDTGTLRWEDGSIGGGSLLPEFTIQTGSCLDLVYTVTAPMNIEDDATVHTNTASFTIGGTTVSDDAGVSADLAAVPVELVDFNVRWGKDKQHAELEWFTASEENTSHFEVQRMTPSDREFQTIGEEQALGYSTELVDYIFTDYFPSDKNYYRLRIVDFDGTVEYSPIASLKRKGVTSLTANSYPNPNQGQFTLEVSSPVTQNVRVIITDISGRHIVQQNLEMQEGTNQLPLDLDLMDGTYIYSIISDTEVVSNKFIVKR